MQSIAVLYKLQLYPHYETLGRHPETAPFVPQWPLLVWVLAHEAESTEAHFSQAPPSPHWPGLKGRSSLQLALRLYLSQLVRELFPWLHTLESSKASFVRTTQSQEVLPTDSLMVTLRKSKVAGCPLTVSSRSLVPGTFLVLSHGKGSLASAASKLRLEAGRTTPTWSKRMLL